MVVDGRGREYDACNKCVACEMSHVTRHTSHHASHVTRHTSHVTRHTSHVTHHTSHVTFQASVQSQLNISKPPPRLNTNVTKHIHKRQKKYSQRSENTFTKVTYLHRIIVTSVTHLNPNIPTNITQSQRNIFTTTHAQLSKTSNCRFWHACCSAATTEPSAARISRAFSARMRRRVSWEFEWIA